MTRSRREFLIAGGALAAAAQVQAQRPPMWKPRVGILVNYSEGNVAFAKQEGFTSIGFWAQPGSNLARGSVTDAGLDKIREDVRQSGLYCSVIGVTANHIDPDLAKRKAVNDHTAGMIEVAGKLGVPHIGTMSGKDP
jgi:sugar phosphate isomerase/epimerase